MDKVESQKEKKMSMKEMLAVAKAKKEAALEEFKLNGQNREEENIVVSKVEDKYEWEMKTKQ